MRWPYNSQTFRVHKFTILVALSSLQSMGWYAAAVAQLLNSPKKTCPRCEGQIGRNHSYTHQPRCMGKCKECSERGISCTYLCNTRISQTVLTCVNCTEHELSCSGRVTYKTDKICFRCEAVPDVSVDMFSSHETDCWGKCENCAQKILPCQFRGIRGNCINCKDQNLVCSGRIAYKNDVENSRDATNSY